MAHNPNHPAPDATENPIPRMFLRTEFNYDMNKAGDESGLNCKDPTLTKQSFAEEVDINTIVRRFHLTGEIPQNVRMPTFEDFTGVTDFHTAMNAIAVAREAFDKMPAEVRARFNNDPGAFVDFTADKNNLAEARKLGMVPPEELPEPEAPPMRVSIVEPLRDGEGRFREQTRAEKRAEAKEAPPKE